jgi:hypothetical protein
MDKSTKAAIMNGTKFRLRDLLIRFRLNTDILKTSSKFPISTFFKAADNELFLFRGESEVASEPGITITKYGIRGKFALGIYSPRVKL